MTAPSLPRLFVRAALTARGRGGELPGTRLARARVTVDPARLADYSAVCGYPLTGALPVTFPHLLAFPLQTALMTERAFPLALPGLVHVRQQVSVVRPIGADEALDVEVWAERLSSHRRGATVDLCAAVSAGGAEVWRGRSTYLARGATVPDGAPEADVDVPVGALDRTSARWRVPADAGRRYARVSGDVNPIHLSALSARLFGFPRAIAHGMWVEARALAALAGRLPDALTVDVAFRKPLLLPSTVDLATARAGEGWDLAVRSRDTEHLIGTVRPT
ncbi:MaoC/PaaZ C-terminal domain-containing protein [Modestobacter sp. VKM Ac-2986]|uniref:MaoC/PaaZ C-terminal domain-containing protein n=1 Tax=Modestobacter sp. VKM Ac-2986 TaxID=3004140 RepID=UPI0022ABA565|nr:MaoC/PaaZ C-terminal domain-containing protein [Modestobacter sp. VKM Ac-2986]MCZ2830917.1 MaoC/PaaZ C-terminal domain-containing protein [Modestobacter sp. VKM Ac-2986]